MSDLAQQCELIESEWPTNREREGDVDVDDPVDCVSVLFAYISELQSELAAIKRSREQEQAYDSMCYELEKSREEIAALRRPVVQSEQTQVSDIRLSEIRQYFSLYSYSTLQSDTVNLLDELKAIRHKSGSQHSDDMAVDRFCLAMKAKLCAKRQEGRCGWEDPQSTPLSFLEDCLRDHVSKGDPVDVANFAMMIWHRLEAGV